MFNFIKVNEHLYYVEGLKNEPTPKICLVVGNKSSMLIDVGNKVEQIDSLNKGIEDNKLPGIKYVVITHFHDDHLHNINLFKDKEIIVSKQTAKYVKFTSQLFIEKTTIDLGNYLVTIDNLPNSHAKGSLLVYLNQDKIMLIGDALCGKITADSYTINRSLTYELKKRIEEYNVDFFIDGHSNLEDTTKEKVYKLIESYCNSLKKNKGDNVSIEDN